MIDNTLYYLFAIISLLFVFGNYILIRSVIWSIVWCDIGGKYRSLNKLKKNVAFTKRIRMNYLNTNVNQLKQQFTYWMKLKDIFIISEILLITIYIVLPILTHNYTLMSYSFVINIIKSFIWFIILGLQFDFNRNTKYDKLRINNSKK